MFDIRCNIDSKDMSDIASKLIDKVCGGVSFIVNRTTNKKLALEEYINDIRGNESLDPRTKAVLIYNAGRDIKRWSNVTAICDKAVERLAETAKIDDVNPDWLSLFQSHAENISTEELQDIWSYILAAEFNEPESIPKALLNTLMSMGKREAEVFNRLASFCVKIDGEMHPIIVQDKIDTYYSEHDLGLNALHRLSTIGLINLDANELGGMGVLVDEDSVVEYFDQKKSIATINNVKAKKGLSVGAVTLSYTGEALMKIIVPDKVDGFFEEIAMPYFENPGKHIEDMFNNTDL